ncbi:MAG: ABC transporter substrate-binding protein [Acidimicrobiales bacterium]|nr:MAG: ABC transporter substrate-binding protein [Acidimicrobiales bacterium]
MRRLSHIILPLLAWVLLGSACGDDTDTGADGRPTVVVTTNILGDVVTRLVGDAAEVVTIMPVGADPHDFQASARQVDAIRSANVLIVNGAGFEEGLLDVIEGAESDGVATFEAISAVPTVEFGEHDHDDHDEDADHDHEGDDPHFFTDPARMALAAEAIADFLIANVDGLDAEAVEATAGTYVAELESLDAEVEALVDRIPAGDRILVTSHEVFGYFAERYGFEVVGAVIPGGSTTDGASAGALAELTATIEAEGVDAIFADTSSSSELVETLADEVGDIEVVELLSESLGDADSDGATYVAMIRTNAERIAAALGS